MGTIPLLPFLSAPVEADPSSNFNEGFVAGTAGTGGVSQLYCPVLYKGALYQMLEGVGFTTDFTPSGGIFVYRSADRGNSWQILDQLAGPSRGSPAPTAGMFFDGGHTMICAFSPTADPINVILGPINLQNFDLSTGTWGPVYASAGTAVYSIQQCFQRPDGSIVVFGTVALASGFIVDITAFVWANNAWTSFPVFTNVNGTFRTNGDVGAVMDSTGGIHLFMLANDLSANPIPTEMFYQLFRANNTLGAFGVIQTGTPNLPAGGINGLEPAISGNNVIIGLVSDDGTYATIAVGTPLSAPVFTRLGPPGVDPMLQLNVNAMGTPLLTADSTGIYAAYRVQSNIDFQSIIRLVASTQINAPLTGWGVNAITAFDERAIPAGNAWKRGIGPFGGALNFLGIQRMAGNLFASASAETDPSGGEPTQFWLGIFNPAPGLMLGGSSSGRFRCCVQPHTYQGTRMAQILHAEIKRQSQWPYVHLEAPVESIPVQAIGSIVAGPVGVLEVIVAYTVPSGFRFYLVGICQDFEGPAVFNPGDALWTVDENAASGSIQGAAVQGLQLLPVPVGSFTSGQWWEFDRPYEFNEQTLLRATVVNVNLIPGAPNFFTSMFLGYLVPVLRP